MVDYEPRQYTGQMWYTPKNNISHMDTRIKLYQPLKPIKDLPKPRTYDTEPPRYVKTRVYEKYTKYDSYAEYVPPWSRGKEKVKRERPPPKPKPQAEKKEEKKKPMKPDSKVHKSKVSFASSAEVVEVL